MAAGAMFRKAALCSSLWLAVAPAWAQDSAPPPAAQAAPRTELAAPGAAPTQEGPIVTAILVEGERRYTETQILAALGQAIGRPRDPEVISRGIETLWTVFHVRARVQERPVDGGVELLLTVEELPVDLEPRFVGNVEIDTKTLKKWALLEEKGELYLYQTARVRQRLIEGYKREGYYFIEVDARVREPEHKPDGGEVLPDVIFEIREGPQVHVSDLLVEGNHSMPPTGMLWWKGGLLKLAKVELDGPWIFNWKGAKFIEETLQADLLAMRNVYRDRGWLDAVVELRYLEFTKDRSKVTVHIVVDEGQPYSVSKLTIRAVDLKYNAAEKKWDETPADLLFPEAELMELCRMKAGKRYERVRQENDKQALRTYYGERGYISHPSLTNQDAFEFLDPELRFDDQTHQVEVTYKLAQGRRRYLREVLFQGATHTRDRILRREISVLPGQLVDQKEVTRSLSRLYSTNYFLDENDPIHHRDPTYRYIPVPGKPDWVDIEYIVEEGRVVNFQISGGIDSNNGLFGILSLSMRNFDAADPPRSVWSTFGDIYDKEAFHGAGQRLDLELSPGTVENFYRIRFHEPDLFRTHFDSVSLDLLLEKRDRNERWYNEQRLDRRIMVGREFGRDLTVAMGYTNQILDVTDIEAPFDDINDPEEIPFPPSIVQEEGRSHLAGVLLDVSFRQLDSTLNAREGYSTAWRNGVYGGPIGGDFQYVRSALTFDWYAPVGAPTEDVRPGFHLGLGLGVADAFGDTSETPYTERFFLGGTTTLRGFDRRGVGPNLNGEPLGGETSTNGTLEYRIPLYTTVQPGTYRSIEVFRMVLFTDAGILDPDPYKLDIDQLRTSAGFGFGLSYPIPLTFNFGFALRSGEGDRKEVFSFSIVNLRF